MVRVAVVAPPKGRTEVRAAVATLIGNVEATPAGVEAAVPL